MEIKTQNGIIGFAIGDALGVSAEFKSRDELKRYPITDMKADGTYNQYLLQKNN